MHFSGEGQAARVIGTPFGVGILRQFGGNHLMTHWLSQPVQPAEIVVAFFCFPCFQFAFGFLMRVELQPLCFCGRYM